MSADQLSTVAEIDSEIERLTQARDERERLLEDPGERSERSLRREQLAGRWAVTLLLKPGNFAAIRRVSGDEAWLWDAETLRADGWSEHGDVWRLQGDAPPQIGVTKSSSTGT